MLLRVEMQAGHGTGTPKAKQIEQAADALAFMLNSLVPAPPKLTNQR